MSVDKFGRYSVNNHKPISLKKSIAKILGVRFDLERNLDLHGKRIMNVGAPIDGNDAATKSSVHQQLVELQQDCYFEIVKSKNDNLRKFNEECEKLRKSVLETDLNLKLFIQNALTDHIKLIEERMSKVEDYIFKYMSDSKIISEKNVDISFEKSKEAEAEYYGYDTLPVANKKKI